MSFIRRRRIAAGRALRIARQRPGTVLLAVTLSAAVLCVALALAAAIVATWPLATRVSLAPEISVFVAPAATAQDVKALQGRIAQEPGVVDVRFVSRDEALTDLARRTGIASPLGEKGNPLPDVLIATLAPGTPPDAVEAAVASLKKLPRVDLVQADGAWYRKLVALARVAQVGGAVASGVLCALLALVLVGAVRLLAHASADEILVLRMVGADDGFIARPYAYLGGAALLLGALVAAGVVTATLRWLQPELEAFGRLYGVAAPIPAVPPVAWVGFVVAAGLVGAWLGRLAVGPAIRSQR